MSRRNSFLRLNKNQTKPSDSPRFSDLDDLEDGFDGEQSSLNPFSSHSNISTTKRPSNEQSFLIRKFQQIMESKDKQSNQNVKKELNSQELSNFSTDDLVNDISDYSIHEGEEIQEGSLPADFVDYSDLSQESIKEINIGQTLINNTSTANNSNQSSTNQSANSATTKNNNETTAPEQSIIVNPSISIPKIDNITTSTNSTTIPTLITSTTTKATSSITTTSTSKESNKRDETKVNTSFLFSKMKKNCSMERLNEPDDKETEKELFDKHKESLNESNSNTNLAAITKQSSSSSLNKLQQQPNIRTPTKQQLLTNRTPTKSSSTSFRSSTLRPRHKMSRFEHLSEESSVDGFNTTDSSDKPNNLFNRRQSSNVTSVDEPIPSLPQFMSFVVNVFRERVNFFSVATSFGLFFLLIFFIQLSPLSSFANGFLIGITFTILFFSIVIIYVLNYMFKKIDYENELHERILNAERWKKYPAYNKLPNASGDNKSTPNNNHSGIHEGWFFELVYSKKLGVDRMTAAEKTDYEKMPDTKLQLTYIKLEGTVMRLYQPKSADQLRKINVDKVSFLKVVNKMNQHNYDFSKMNTKKIQLWLPKNIINKKKYLWSRKFPLILVIEETNKMSEKQRTPFNLILFSRTNRDKEEWFNKLRQSIEIAEQNLQIHHLSTAASTPDEVTHEENIPRTKSLDIGNISYEFEHLSSFLSYDTFIQDLVNQNLYSLNQSVNATSSNAQSTNGASSSNNQQNTSDQANSNLLWFNALVGRVFFDFLTHPHWTRWVQLKIQRKLSRIKLPFFINTIILKDVNLGTSMPKFLSVANNPVIDEKGIWIDFDLDYQGSQFSMKLETKIDLMKLKETKAPERELKPIKSLNLNQAPYDCDDLSDPESIVSLSDEDSEENLSIENSDKQARIVKLLDKLVVNKYFQQATDTKFLKKKMEEFSQTPIQLIVNIYKLKGVLTINLPPAPTDRLWYGFRSIEDFQLECKPAVGERSIQLNPIIQILSKKLKQEFHKILVLPNLDDLIINNVMMGHEDISILDEVP